MCGKSWISDFGDRGHAYARVCLVLVVLTCFANPAANALKGGDKPPRIDLPDRTGATVDLDKLVGQVVLVDFWASWCRPCKKEMPALQRLYEKYRSRGLVVIGINIDRSEKKMNRFLKEVPVSFRIVHDKDLDVANRYAPPRMPSSYFIGRDGRVVHIHEGFRPKDAEAIERKVRALLAR